jgi:hypothetical protein
MVEQEEGPWNLVLEGPKQEVNLEGKVGVVPLGETEIPER